MNIFSNHLVKRAKQGDKDAFVELYNRHHNTIYRYIYFRVGNGPVAEDLSAEVFVRMIDKIHLYTENGKPLLAWLYAIAHNLVVDFHRQKPMEGEFPYFDDSTRDMNEETQPPLILEKHHDQDCLIQACQKLTEEQRQVIFFKFIEGWSNADVARVMNKSEGAVKSIQHRALASLRRILEMV